MTRPLVVGQAPSASAAEGWVPLDPRSASGRRLAGYAGLEPGELHRRADFVNLLPAFPGRQEDGKYDRFDRPTAVVHAALLGANGQLSGRPVVLLGVGVRDAFRRAFGMPKMPWFEPVPWPHDPATTVYSSPHPAGTSMFWNDPAARAAGEAFWRALLSEEGSP